MRDPYATLGVARSASDTEIKNAYRRHAKRLHPDMHDGDAALEARFQEIQEAYSVLKDRERRRRFDMGEGTPPPSQPRAETFEDALNADAKHARGRQDRDTLFTDFLSTFRKARRNLDNEPGPAPPPTGPVTLKLTFGEAVTGARKTVTLPSGKRIAITVPPGAENGQTIHMRNASTGPAQRLVPGELSVVLEVAPDPRFERDGSDLVTTLPITLDEALLGAKVKLQAPGGELLVTIPRGSNTGHILKLRGRGLPKGDGETGDLRVTLVLKLPQVIDSELEAVIKSWAARHPYNVRD